MQHVHADTIIGINWGSSNLRAYLIGPDAQVLDRWETAAGVAAIGREAMIEAADRIRSRWPTARHAYAAGMIGSSVGWIDAGYIDCPAGVADVAGRLVAARIGTLEVDIVPGLACVRQVDAAPDVMRGEETELFGLWAQAGCADAPVVALPGTHTKWVQWHDGRIQAFMTSMSGELFDRLASAGLLASVLDGPGHDGPAFIEGVRTAASGTLGLGTLLFGVRARQVRGTLARDDTSAYLRGLLAGAEIADALALFPALRTHTVPLVGAAAVCQLYRTALATLGIASTPVASAGAIVRGFQTIDALRRPA
ncbi:2-dehydro-3-deoxygalactonokinase [Stenotrophomonas sp. 24(2023)]|uniref:2-dehydro-3-deoxygalactonokinase n=1 Tax=Stenotrophomonas sp. 24(2023) TaxID=3068324 RepID=UPI0027DF0BE2|nr:2-dehydro-3-deoxygalactonokinase [Stenotrophomonas sp. 24(2023)]WMJ68237.1 2-dehydro-3-deoxygalactonokinase [Stenotrophomonas sp. 24(2023)]